MMPLYEDNNPKTARTTVIYEKLPGGEYDKEDSTAAITEPTIRIGKK